MFYDTIRKERRSDKNTRKSLSNKIRIRFQNDFTSSKYILLWNRFYALFYSFFLQIWSSFFVEFLQFEYMACNVQCNTMCKHETIYMPNAKNGWNQMIFCLFIALCMYLLIPPSHLNVHLLCIARQSHKSTVPLLVFRWLVCALRAMCTNNESENGLLKFKSQRKASP